MPSPNHLKIKERITLSNRILSNGIKMTPCANCKKKGRSCVVSKESKRCAECVRRGVRCDVLGPSTDDWDSLQREEERLEREVAAAIQQAQEAFARQLRLMKQQKLLKSRASEMLRRGLKTLDQLDEVEEKERLQQDTETQLAALCPVEVQFPDFADDEIAALMSACDDDFCVIPSVGPSSSAQDVFDGILPATQGN